VDSKLPVQAARLALVLHCLWHADDPRVMVSRERVEDGIDLAECFRAHALRVLCHFGVSAVPAFAGLPARVLRALERAGDDPASPERWVSRTRLHRGLGNAVKAPELDAALAALTAAGRVERGELPTATKAAEAWRVLTLPTERMIHYEESPTEAAGEGEIIHKRSFIRGRTDAVADDEAKTRAMVAVLVDMTPDEIAAYRRDLEAADPSDPPTDDELEALRRAEAIRAASERGAA